MARNAYRGGERQKLYAEAKAVSALLHANRALIDDVRGGSQ